MMPVAGMAQGYDKAGNQTVGYSADRGTSYTYRYDQNNRLTGIYDDTDTTRKAAFAYDALGRRIEFVNDTFDQTTEYWYDGQNEIDEMRTTNAGDLPTYSPRYFIHGVSYIDERLVMHTISRPYYYVLDRMYNVRALVDRAGAIIERYVYDDYGRPLIRESAGRGDMNNDTDITTGGTSDSTRFVATFGGTLWDPRGDMNDDGSNTVVGDYALFNNAEPVWNEASPTVSQAFSDLDNPFMFQGRPHFAIDTADDAEHDGAMLLLNDHRARMNDPVIGRWLTRDPVGFRDGTNRYRSFGSNPISNLDPKGLALLHLEINAFIPGIINPWNGQWEWLPQPPFFIWEFRTDERGFGGGSSRLKIVTTFDTSEIGDPAPGLFFVNAFSFPSQRRTCSWCPIETKTSIPRLSWDYRNWRACRSRIHVKGAANYPFVPGSPDIDIDAYWDLTIEDDGSLAIDVSGFHDEFPNYEALVRAFTNVQGGARSTNIYKYATLNPAGGPGIFNLNNRKPIRDATTLRIRDLSADDAQCGCR